MKSLFTPFCPPPSSLLIPTCLLLAACNSNAPTTTHTENPSPSELGHPSEQVDEVSKKSIIRSDIEPLPSDTLTTQPAQITVPFPDKGVAIDAERQSLLDTFIAAPAIEAGWPITIWGHSDSQGTDIDNLRSSKKRAETIRSYFMEKGIPQKQITIIAMGESNPIAPNRNLDGTDDPIGRAKNRRVDIRVDMPSEAETPSTSEKTATKET